MKTTIENAMDFAHQVMDAAQVRDFNAWAETTYADKDSLLCSETAERLAEFFAF